METGRTPSILQSTPNRSPDQPQGRWYIVRTNPRCEERAARSMEEAGFAVYAPRLRKVVVHHRSKRVINREFPMLVGYVFVLMPPAGEDFGFVRECDGVRSFVGMNQNTPSALSVAEMDALQEIEGSQWLRQDLAFRGDMKVPRRAARGLERVTINAGPLSGFVGHLTHAKHRGAVKLIASLFSAVVEVTLQDGEIERAA